MSATASYRPVVLAIDDLQWADRDTLLLLSELLTVSLRNVLVVGAHRAGEFDPGAAGLKSESLNSIQLQPLAPEDVEELLAAVCGQSVEMGDVAAEFHHRTGGNPLQVRQLLYRAQREGALSPVGPGGHPSWDLRVLTSIEITATAAEFLGRYLGQLRPIERAVLGSLSCIGGEFDLDDATAAAAQPPDVVAQALWSALELRLLEAVDSGGRRITNTISRDARYRFSHDRVAEGPGQTCPPTPSARRTSASVGGSSRWGTTDCSRPPATSAPGAEDWPTTTNASDSSTCCGAPHGRLEGRPRSHWPFSTAATVWTCSARNAGQLTTHSPVSCSSTPRTPLFWWATRTRCMRCSTRPNRFCTSLLTVDESPTSG